MKVKIINKFIMLKKMIKEIFGRFGLSVINKNYLENVLIKNYNQELLKENKILTNVIQLFVDANFSPNHIIDVGANKGEWSRQVMRYFPNSYYTIIEPQSWLKPSFEDLLRNTKVRYYPVGLGQSPGNFQFTIHERDDSSSFIYNSEQASLKGYKQIPVKVMTINQIIAESDFPKPDIIKIDAEGLDIQVLKGGSNILEYVEVLFLEAGVGNRFYENSVIEVVNFMDNLGFVLFDITSLNRSYTMNVLWLLEFVFIKKSGKLDEWVKQL